MKSKDGYMPTPARIRRECEKIRQTWSEATRLRRLRVDLRPVPFQFPTINESELVEHEDGWEES